MPKIKVNTTLRNTQELGGLVRSGSEHRVSEDYAKELVEDRGYASYVEEDFEIVSTNQGDFPKGFIQEEIPENFPSETVFDTLLENDIFTFEKLVGYENFEDINGIGEKYAEKLTNGLKVAAKDWKNKNG